MKPIELKKHQQKIVFILIGALALGIFYMSYLAIAPQETTLPQNPATRIELSNPTYGVKVEDILVQKHSDKLDLLDQRINQTNELLSELRQNNQKRAEENKLNERDDIRIKQLENEIQQIQQKSHIKTNMNDHEGSRISNVTAASSGIIKKKPRNLQNYLPAGSYAEAEVIAAVDAGVGINAQSDAKPMLLRLVGKAQARMHKGRLQEVDVSGCTVTAAAYGDLSTEQIFVRLDKLICSNEHNETIETDVEGYVTNHGKVGIRGTLVRREGDLLTKSFLAGLAGGMGSNLAQSLNTPIVLPGGQAAKQNDEYKGIAMSGISQGVGNASNKLSEYYIQRAEQHQPVIVVPGGIKVEVIFSKGVYLDEENN